MTAFFTGLIFGFACYFVLKFKGKDAVTSYDKGMNEIAGIGISVIVALFTWLIGFVFWLF